MASSFARLATRIFTSRDLSIHTKVKVYRAVCLLALLYASETQIPYKCISKNKKIPHRMRPKDSGVENRVPHVEIMRRAGIEPVNHSRL